MKVLFIWDVPNKLKAHLISELNGLDIELIFPEDMNDEDRLIDEGKGAEVIVGWRPIKGLLDTANSLRLYINPGAGVQHLQEFTEKLRKVTVVNGHGNSFYTAEHIMAMLLALANRIVEHHNWMRSGKWRLGDKEAKSFTLRDRSVGLLGYGHVGKKLHAMLQPFNSEVKILKSEPEEGMYGPDELNAFLKCIDILVVIVPLTATTKGMIGEEELSQLSENAIVINAGRGEVVEEEALYKALKNKTISSAAIDVWYNYKPEEDENGNKRPFKFPFHELDNLLMSPHRAASPFDDLDRWDDVIENIKRAANGDKEFLNIVDLDRGY